MVMQALPTAVYTAVRCQAPTGPAPRQSRRVSSTVAARTRTVQTTKEDNNKRAHLKAALAGGMAALMIGQPALADAPAVNREVDNSSSPYIQELLKRTEENKDRRYKERLDSYYCRNFKDYFDFEVGGRGVAQMRGVQKKNSDAIVSWLKEHPSCKVVDAVK